MRTGREATRICRRAHLVRLGRGRRSDSFCKHVGAPTNDGTALDMAKARLNEVYSRYLALEGEPKFGIKAKLKVTRSVLPVGAFNSADLRRSFDLLTLRLL